MHKNNDQIQILIIVSALSMVIITNGLQCHHQHHLAFGQTPPPEASVEENQTFRSALDTFVSSEPGGYGIMMPGNLISSSQEKHSCYMLNL